MKFKTLPQQLTIAIGQYIVNSLKSRKMVTSSSTRFEGNRRIETETLSDGRPWDKQADLKRLDDVAGSLGWGFEACAGTFWFYPPKVKKYHLTISEETWPLAEVKPNKKKA